MSLSFIRGIFMLTTTELLKIRSYRAPRDKIICVLNCCKVIFGEQITPAAVQSSPPANPPQACSRMPSRIPLLTPLCRC